MLPPLRWILQRLVQILPPSESYALLNEFGKYQTEYGRWQRHQAKLARLARLKEALKNPSSRTHMRNLQVQIAKLEAHLGEEAR
jgi:hypothetical protein